MDRWNGDFGFSLILRVQFVKTQHVPKDQKNLFHHLVQGFEIESFRISRLINGIHVPTHSVCAVLVNNFYGIDNVSNGLAHFLSLRIKDMTQTNHVLIRCLFPEKNRDGQQGIKPPARLIDRFGNIVRGKRRRFSHPP